MKDYANNVGLSKGNGDQQSETVDKQPLQVPSITVSQRLDGQCDKDVNILAPMKRMSFIILQVHRRG